MKEPKFKVGETVYINKTGFIGTIISIQPAKVIASIDCTLRHSVYYIKIQSGAGKYYEEYELRPITEGNWKNIPIRSIKSLIKKSVVNPTSNQAEKKAIDLFVHMTHSMSDAFTNSTYNVDENDVNVFKEKLGYIEKMAIEFYKTIKP